MLQNSTSIQFVFINTSKICTFGLYYFMMRYRLFLIVFFFLATSCQFIETKKISTETFYEEEIKSINWKDVDQYPAFKDCEKFTEKNIQKTCFESTLTSHLYNSISSKNIIARHRLQDTITLKFSISKTGELRVTKIEIDSLLEVDFPMLKQYILQSIDSLPTVAPAYKRGIPVNTTFILPIVFQTQ